MAKATIGRLFWGSLVAFAGALVLLAAAGGLALANGSLVRDGPDVTGIRETPFGWVMAGLAGVAILVMLAAAVTQFIAMIIYLIAGPDDSAPHPATTAADEAPPRELRRRSA